MSKKNPQVIVKFQPGATGLDKNDPHYNDPSAFAEPVEAEDIKVVQLHPDERKRLLKEGTTSVYTQGFQFLQFPDGSLGYKATFEDGTEKYFSLMIGNGKSKEIKLVDKTFVWYDSLMDKLEVFLIGEKDRAYNTSKVDKVHAAMFGVGAVLACLVVAGIAWLLR